MKYIQVDNEKLKTYVESQNKIDPERDKSHLDYLHNNIALHASEILSWENAFLEIDHDTQTVSKMGEELVGDYKTIPIYWVQQSTGQQLYNNLIMAIDEAKWNWEYGKIFKEIESK